MPLWIDFKIPLYLVQSEKSDDVVLIFLYRKHIQRHQIHYVSVDKKLVYFVDQSWILLTATVCYCVPGASIQRLRHTEGGQSGHAAV